MEYIRLDLQYFAEDGEAAAAAAPEAAEASGGSDAAETFSQETPVQVGDTLADGQKVKSPLVAAELERQMKRHPELRKVYGQTGAQGNAAPQAQAGQPEQKPQEPTLQERWEQAKKGEFKDLYGQDVQNAVRDRFKNQDDARAQLDGLQPMLQALMNKAGVESVEELSQLVLDDDSLYEDAAEEAGMTVERYKEFKALQEEHDRREAQDRENEERTFWNNHISKIMAQAEELKKTFPNFDLDEEMKNEEFKRLTHPSVGISVEDAYYTIHRKELEPQMLAYGMNRAREQMGQTIQAQRSRPVEGAMRSQGQLAADMKTDFSRMTRRERDEYRRRVHAGLVKGDTFA